jgi:hypothetical protein
VEYVSSGKKNQKELQAFCSAAPQLRRIEVLCQAFSRKRNNSRPDVVFSPPGRICYEFFAKSVCFELG